MKQQRAQTVGPLTGPSTVSSNPQNVSRNKIFSMEPILKFETVKNWHDGRGGKRKKTGTYHFAADLR